MDTKSFLTSKTAWFAAALAALVQFQEYTPMLQDVAPITLYGFIATWVPVAIVVLRALTNKPMSPRLPLIGSASETKV